MKNDLSKELPTATWTNFNDEWMIRSENRLKEGESVMVLKKDGSGREYRVGELEKHYPANNGKPESFIYSVSNC